MATYHRFCAGWSKVGEARRKTILPLGLFSGFPDLVLPEDVRYRLERSFSRELGDWRRGMKVVIIAETKPPETSFRQTDGRSRPTSCITVIDVALMTVSPRFIQLDSGYEGAVEEKLWQEKRAFIKPLPTTVRKMCFRILCSRTFLALMRCRWKCLA